MGPGVKTNKTAIVTQVIQLSKAISNPISPGLSTAPCAASRLHDGHQQIVRDALDSVRPMY